MYKDAYISDCGRYRYSLCREWDSTKAKVCWIMLNPSTADANIDDATIKRCIYFSMQWGFGGMVVLNLYALRATNPAKILKTEDPVGPENDKIIRLYMDWPIVVAWGTLGAYKNRDKVVLEILKGSDIKSLGKTKMGLPRHPLYLRKDTLLEPFHGRSGSW